MLKAILFDTRSIQRYIFAGTMLRTNIGASYLVDKVYERWLRPALVEVLGEHEVDWEGWKKVDSPNWEAQETRARIGYIGGGNALVLLRAETDEATCREIVSAFSRSLITDAPGLKIGAAIGELEIAADGSYSDKEHSLTALLMKLKETQNTVFPEVAAPYTGLTQVCDVSGSAANAYSPELRRYVSAEVAAKLAVATKKGGKLADTETELWKNLTEVAAGLGAKQDSYAFPTEFDRLGQREGKNDIAIVHIDGNNMGAKFGGLTTLTERKNMSLAIRRATVKAFAQLVEHIIAELPNCDSSIDDHYDEERRRYLPIRPLILGGDDMTFVCPAVLALDFSRFVMERLLEAEPKHIDSCGGIAILNTSYPFSRGYVLAEQACDAAKNKMRHLANVERQDYRQEESAWLEYVILHGEQAPTLEEIRHSEYPGGLHFGPYRIDDDSSHYALARVVAAAKELRKLSRGKVKEMRDVLKRDRHAALRFIEQLECTDAKLPVIKGWEIYNEALWHEHDGVAKTPWCDAIELLDYLPVAREESK